MFHVNIIAKVVETRLLPIDVEMELNTIGRVVENLEVESEFVIWIVVFAEGDDRKGVRAGLDDGVGVLWIPAVETAGDVG